MNILYRPGEQHAHADALSRIPRHTVAFVLWMGWRIYHVKDVLIVKELRINGEHFQKMLITSCLDLVLCPQ